jgi:hypothetical protein
MGPDLSFEDEKEISAVFIGEAVGRGGRQRRTLLSPGGTRR